MKIISTIILTLSAAVGFAQLTVKPTAGGENSYIYVKDEVLYVKEDINLEANNDAGIANIYLRYEGQLIQGTTGTSTNSGTGVLSVFQEGEANEWAYNYWGSPVGIASGTEGNTDFGIPLFHTPTTTLLSTPTTAIGGYTSYSGVPVAIAKYWIWKFTGETGAGGTDYYDWQHVQDAISIGAGEGFTMKGTSGGNATEVDGVVNDPGDKQRYDFRGRPNDGTISLNMAEGESYLVGNPYPSAIDLSYFLLENSGTGTFTACDGSGDVITKRNATTGIAYFWDSDPSVQSHNIADYVGGYETFAPTACGTTGVYAPATYHMYDLDGNEVGTEEGTGTSHERLYTPIGQGFFIEGAATASPENLEFSNRHRIFIRESHPNSEFHKFSEEPSNSVNSEETTESGLEVIPKLRLNIVFNNQYTRQAVLAFWYTATDGVDPAMDAKNADAIASDAGWLLNNDNYVIDVRQFDIQQQIPLFLKLNAEKNIKFRINNFENFDVENVYILDKMTQTYHPIKEQTFSITLPPGTYHERFKLTFLNEEGQTALNDNNQVRHDFDVFQNNNQSQLEVRNPNNVEVTSVAMYDLTGKQIFAERNIGTQSVYTFPTRNLQEAVYIVKITTKDNQETARKISIVNRN